MKNDGYLKIQDEDTIPAVSRLMRCLRELLESPSPNPCSVEDAVRYPEFAALHLDMSRLREFAFSVAQGDLSKRLVMHGYLAGTLKALQANLAHLTWQTQMIASGDLTQRVEFLGEFSRAFNGMVSFLEDNRRQLVDKKEELKAANDQLRAEIEAKNKVQRQLQQSKQRYRTLAMRDSLSGLFNRRFFFMLGRRELARAIRKKSPLSCILFDIDHFKRVNDTLGHAAGDEVIRAIGSLALETLRAVDLCGRYGGEEFVILLPDCPQDFALAVAERLRYAIADHVFTHGGEQVLLTASFGVVTLSLEEGAQSVQKLDTLVALADKALYTAKALGRNRVEAV